MTSVLGSALALGSYVAGEKGYLGHWTGQEAAPTIIVEENPARPSPLSQEGPLPPQTLSESSLAPEASLIPGLEQRIGALSQENEELRLKMREEKDQDAAALSALMGENHELLDTLNQMKKKLNYERLSSRLGIFSLEAGEPAVIGMKKLMADGPDNWSRVLHLRDMSGTVRDFYLQKCVADAYVSQARQLPQDVSYVERLAQNTTFGSRTLNVLADELFRKDASTLEKVEYAVRVVREAISGSENEYGADAIRPAFLAFFEGTGNAATRVAATASLLGSADVPVAYVVHERETGGKKTLAASLAFGVPIDEIEGGVRGVGHERYVVEPNPAVGFLKEKLAVGDKDGMRFYLADMQTGNPEGVSDALLGSRVINLYVLK